MPGIKVREGEHPESAMRRFKRSIEKSGLLSEMRRREFFEKPSERKKRALAAAVKRFRKKQQRDGSRIEPGFASGGGARHSAPTEDRRRSTQQ